MSTPLGRFFFEVRDPGMTALTVRIGQTFCIGKTRPGATNRIIRNGWPHLFL
ncbi:hypothetical protein SAMN05444166_3675 [Singulisphaera sp. GP187]|nr:hypothetical protein SAMN05444166_3675 [Singulisphaera sp. GP187]